MDDLVTSNYIFHNIISVKKAISFLRKLAPLCQSSSLDALLAHLNVILSDPASAVFPILKKKEQKTGISSEVQPNLS